MTPMTGCEALPVVISWSAVLRAWSLGMAKPTPMLPDWPESSGLEPGMRAIAELTPMTRPDMSSSGPPELPGLIAASVWIALMNAGASSAPPGVTGRLSALTIPLVTVLSRPSGAPTATTGSPTTTEAELPSGRTGRPVRFTRTTARSYDASRPTMVAGSWEPSENSTRMLPVAAAEDTTWLLVRMKPSLLITKPDPVPWPSAPLTLSVTTDGRALAAMPAIEPWGRLVDPGWGTGSTPPEVVPLLRVAISAPAVPPSSAAISTAAASMATVPALHRDDRWPGTALVGGGVPPPAGGSPAPWGSGAVTSPEWAWGHAGKATGAVAHGAGSGAGAVAHGCPAPGGGIAPGAAAGVSFGSGAAWGAPP